MNANAPSQSILDGADDLLGMFANFCDAADSVNETAIEDGSEDLLSMLAKDGDAANSVDEIAIREMHDDIREEDMLLLKESLPENYGMKSEAWTSFLLNFKSAGAYDKQVMCFLKWYHER